MLYPKLSGFHFTFQRNLPLSFHFGLAVFNPGAIKPVSNRRWKINPTKNEYIIAVLSTSCEQNQNKTPSICILTPARPLAPFFSKATKSIWHRNENGFLSSVYNVPLAPSLSSAIVEAGVTYETFV